jgi:sigma-B regulation protein RsbU (phosphoserine phosphatase)
VEPLVIPSATAWMPLVVDFVRAVAAEAGLSAEATYRLRLAVDEIVSNIVGHGYVESGHDGLVRLRARVTDDAVEVIIEDDAPIFDPQATPAPGVDLPADERPVGGLGLFLAQHCVDDLRYERRGDLNRNILVVRRGDGDRVTPPGRVLVVGDRPDIVEWLRAEGHDVVSASALAVALDRCADEPFDVVIYGAEVSPLTTAQLGDRSDPPGVLVLAESVDGAEAHLLDEGVDWARTPPHPAELRGRVSRLVERRALRARLWRARMQLGGLHRLADDFTHTVLPLGLALSREEDADRLTERIVVEAQTLCNADGGTLYLRHGPTLRFALVRNDSLGIRLGGLDGAPVPFEPLQLYDQDGTPNTHNVATTAALEGHTINVPDIYAAAHGPYDFSGPRAFDATYGYHTTSCLTVPLAEPSGRLLGALQLVNARDRETGGQVPFGAYLQKVVESMASQAAVALSKQRLTGFRDGMLELAQDLAIGRRILESFQPVELPAPDGWTLAARMRPARNVGGDLYDAFPCGDRLMVVVADVCDKGVGAAVFMGLLRTLLRAYAETTGGLTATIQHTNRYLVREHGALNMFATVFAATLDPRTGELRYVNAGHGAALRVRRGRVDARFAATGPAVGVIDGAAFRVGHARLAPGDGLLVFTDGVTDARDPDGRAFGVDAAEVAVARPVPDAEGLVEALDAALRTHVREAEPFDDVAMLGVVRAAE